MDVVYKYFAQTDESGDGVGELLCEQRTGSAEFPPPTTMPRPGETVRIPLAHQSGWVSGVVVSNMSPQREPVRVWEILLSDLKPV